MKYYSLKILGFSILFGLLSNVAIATQEYAINIKDHQFEPTELVVPANQKIKLKISNLDSTPEEFESDELDREKVIVGNSSAVIFIGPLSPGVYPFFGEFNPETAKGHIRAE